MPARGKGEGLSRRDPRSASPYLNFDLLIERQGDRYRIRVIGSPSGEEDDTFPAPFTESELEVLTGRLEGARGRMRRMNSPQLALAKEMGGRLYETAMTPAIRRSLARAVDQAQLQDVAGVRVRLRLDSAPELAVLPWELMYDADPRVGRFVALAEETPLVRYLNLPERIRPLKVTPPVRVLVVIANPADDRYPELDVESEWRRLQDEALKDSIDQGLISLTRVRRGTLSALQQELLETDYNVLHYVGHGRFDQQHQDGLLVFEGERGGVNEVSAERFGALLHNERQLGLAVVNACEGGRAAATDPYAGMAQTLVRMGVPAVVAMQFEISDRAAITFARYFYWNIARGRPVDTAITHARMAVFQQVSEVEWATPVLYMRAPDGRIFDIDAIATPKPAPVVAPPPVVVEAPAPASPRAATVVLPPTPKPEPVQRPHEPRRPSPLATGLRRAGALAIGIPANAARGAGRAMSSTVGVAARLPVVVAAAATAAARNASRISPRMLRMGLVGVVTFALTGAAVLAASMWPRLDQAAVDVPQPTAVPSLQASPTVASTQRLNETLASPSGSPGDLATQTPVTTVAPSTAPTASAVTAAPATPAATVAPTLPPTTAAPTATAGSTNRVFSSTVRGSLRWVDVGLSGALVDLQRSEAPFEVLTRTTTGADGRFFFPTVPADSYVIRVQFPEGSDFQPGGSTGAKSVAVGGEVDFGIIQVLKYVRGLAPNNVLITTPFTFRWDAFPGASSYQVEAFKYPLGGPAAIQATTANFQYAVASLPAGRYIWSVRAFGGNPQALLGYSAASFEIP